MNDLNKKIINLGLSYLFLSRYWLKTQSDRLMLSNLQYLYPLIFLDIAAFITIYTLKKKQLITKGVYHMTNGGKKNVLFIFGAGISLASHNTNGEPVSISTDKITKAIFTEKLQLDYSEWFYPPEENNSSPTVDEGIHPLLRLIRCKFIKHLGCKENQVTYEDIFYFLISLDHESGYAKNPLLKSAVAQFADEACITWRATNGLGEDYELWKKLYLTQNYIKSVVKFRLCNLRKPIGYCWIKDAINDEAYKSNIVTLNHDLLLDIFFENAGIKFCDGFKKDPEKKVKIFDPRYFLDTDKPHLIKLHGSINWKAYGGAKRHLVAIPMEGYDRNEILYGGATDEIHILAGTHNKLEDYSYSIYADLVAQYQRLLWTTDYVIICGYGFGDRGINSRLSNWLRLDIKNQIIVIHHDKEKLKRNLEHHAAQLLNQIDPKRIHFEEKKFEDIQWDDVKKFM